MHVGLVYHYFFGFQLFFAFTEHLLGQHLDVDLPQLIECDWGWGPLFSENSKNVTDWRTAWPSSIRSNLVLQGIASQAVEGKLLTKADFPFERGIKTLEEVLYRREHHPIALKRLPLLCKVWNFRAWRSRIDKWLCCQLITDWQKEGRGSSHHQRCDWVLLKIEVILLKSTICKAQLLMAYHEFRDWTSWRLHPKPKAAFYSGQNTKSCTKFKLFYLIFLLLTKDHRLCGLKVAQCLEQRWHADRWYLSDQITGPHYYSAHCWFALFRVKSFHALLVVVLWRMQQCVLMLTAFSEFRQCLCPLNSIAQHQHVIASDE